MPEESLSLSKAPIVEAVVDIDCEMSTINWEDMERRAAIPFLNQYPVVSRQVLNQATLEAAGADEPKVSMSRSLQALRFGQKDGRQLVQVRAQGFSFNRLAPYASLDDYMSEIQRTWRAFVELTTPIQVRAIRLRYINQIPLPLGDGNLDLGDYFTLGPGMPKEENLTFANFLNRFSLVETPTGNQVSITLATNGSVDKVLPVVLDIEATTHLAVDPADWPPLLDKIQSLRDLKNRVFKNTLTEKCLKLFQ